MRTTSGAGANILKWGPLALVFVASLAVAYFGHSLALHLPIGKTRDDGIYALAGRALRQGLGYVDLINVGHPPVMRYPPGFPALLALAGWGTQTVQAEAARLLWVAPISGCLLVLLTYGYLRRRGGVSAWPAAALAATGGVQAISFTSLATVMADVPFALACLGVIWGAEAAFASGTTGLAAWVGLGVATSGAYMLRTAGLTLILAIGGVLLYARRFKACAAYLLGLAPVMIAFNVYQQLHANSDYLSVFGTRLPDSPELALIVLGTVVFAAFGNALPSILMGWPFFLPGQPPTPLNVSLGTAVSLVIFRGVSERLRGPFAPERALPAVFVLITLVITGVYALAYAFYAGPFLQRAFIPMVPFVLLFAYEGARRGANPRLAAVLTPVVLVLSLVGNTCASMFMINASLSNDLINGETRTALDFIAAHVPPDAVLMSPFAPMVTFYTGRVCVEPPHNMSGSNFVPTLYPRGELLRYLAKTHTQYLFAVPYAIDGTRPDLAKLNLALLQLPKLMKPIYTTWESQVMVYVIDQKVLQQDLQQLAATGSVPDAW